MAKKEKFKPPPKELVTAMNWALERYFRPKFEGLDNIPRKGPALLVANHAIMGNYDLAVMPSVIYRETGIYVRGLADRNHYKIPVWRDFITRMGAVEGTRENCRRLFKEKQKVLVYPGGTREVVKKKSEVYKLVWKERLGFARMAIEAGVPIVPISVVGPDEVYDIVYDTDDFKKSLIGSALVRSGLLDKYLRGADELPPLVSGRWGTLVPKRETFRFKAGKPIKTKKYKGQEDDPDVLMKLRAKVARRIEKGIEKLRDKQASDSPSP